MEDDNHQTELDSEQETSNRNYQRPYSTRHPVPTVQHYKQIRQEREKLDDVDDGAQDTGRKRDGLKNILQFDSGSRKEDADAKGWADQGYNRNHSAISAEDPSSGQKDENVDDQDDEGRSQGVDDEDEDGNDSGNDEKPVDTSEAISNETDPRKKRKAMKGRAPEKDKRSRKVTDPITHLPVTIHDFTTKELADAPANLPPFGSQPRTATGVNAESKDDEQLESERREIESGTRGMQRLFPPPSFEALKTEIGGVYVTAFAACATLIGIILFLTLGIASWVLSSGKDNSRASWFTATAITMGGLATSGAALSICKGWLGHKIDAIWQDDVWEAARLQERKEQHKLQIPESAMWLNSILASIWPLINPDLFASLVDTLEDVMQASLPMVVRMIAIDDFGQGKSALRILGVRWLPTGAATRSVSKDGKLKPQSKEKSDREDPDQGQVEDSSDSKKDQNGKDSEDKDSEETSMAEGLEAESGDFMNMELSFSYRATSKGKSLKKKNENAHMYLVFYLPANVPVPVWVAIDGIVGTMRLRFQTAPDPPFIKLCTISFMGQPKASISCVPLVKKGPNVMDIPLISSFVQSSVDAALAEYVAPKSLTLDLKQMLKGDDFKKDTVSRGAIFVRIRHAEGMKEGDSSIPLIKNGSSDCYVSCGWAKFSKPMWSTRIIIADMKPSFEEHCILLVGLEELNAHERLRLQLWDSDRTSADDDLGRIEVDLNDLMSSEETKGKICPREDNFVGLDGDTSMPGTLSWEVGYFNKVEVTHDQLEKQDVYPDIRTLQQLKDKVAESTEKKLREAPHKVKAEEASQQRDQEYEDEQHELICAAPPPEEFCSGILSIQVHNATGLEISSLRKKTKEEEEESENFEDDLPSPYCSIIINGKIVYKTRTKPKNSNPFFNAGTERFIRDWRETEVIVAVRDARVHENDPLLGIVYMPLGFMFDSRSQVNDIYPISGGVGFGRLRVSLMFRAVDMKLPKELRGWDYGTLEINPAVNSENLPNDLKGMRLKVHTTINRAKLKSNKDGTWTENKGRKIHLAVQKRYSSALVVEFRSDRTLKDKTPAYGILWLKDVVDDTDSEIDIPIWRGNKSDFKRAQANVLEEMGERVGSVKLQLKLHAGLSDYHRKLRDSGVKDVLECLDVASDNKDLPDDESLSEDDSDSDATSKGEHQADHTGNNNEDGEDDHVGPIKAAKDYKNRSKTLHRQHRGVMQWKIARTASWMETKVKDDIGGKVKDAFKRKGRGQGIETEV